jgi:hypothetical protein
MWDGSLGAFGGSGAKAGLACEDAFERFDRPRPMTLRGVDLGEGHRRHGRGGGGSRRRRGAEGADALSGIGKVQPALDDPGDKVTGKAE